MTDIIDHKILGDDMQIVEVKLDPGEGVRAEARAAPSEASWEATGTSRTAPRPGRGEIYVPDIS